MAVLDQQEDGALQVDLYELPMSAGYFRYRPDIRATFNLSVIPFLSQRNCCVFVEAGSITTNQRGNSKNRNAAVDIYIRYCKWLLSTEEKIGSNAKRSLSRPINPAKKTEKT